MNTDPSKNLLSRKELLLLLGSLMVSCGEKDFTSQLRRFLVKICGAPLGLCIFTFQKDAVPVPLISSTIYEEGMANYCNALYLLDPYYNLFSRENFHGFAKWDDIAPGNFEKTSGPYWDYYKEWDFLDEVGYIVPLSTHISLHLSIARKRGMQRYNSATTDLLREFYPVVAALMTRHWRHVDRVIDSGESERRQLHDRVRSILHDFGSSVLTPREREIVQLLLKGYSYKTIADVLAISLGTVNTHRANIYEKLDISSSGELFSLLIGAMTSVEFVKDKDVLCDYFKKPD